MSASNPAEVVEDAIEDAANDHDWPKGIGAFVMKMLSEHGYSIVKFDDDSATSWHRVLADDGSLWMETSDAAEARAEARELGYGLERLWVQREVGEWREVKL